MQDFITLLLKFRSSLKLHCDKNLPIFFHILENNDNIENNDNKHRNKFKP